MRYGVLWKGKSSCRLSPRNKNLLRSSPAVHRYFGSFRTSIWLPIWGLMPLLLAGYFLPYGYKSLSRQRFLLLGTLTFVPTKPFNRMKTQKIISIVAGSFIAFSALAIVMVSVMAFSDPQAVMDLVKVKLTVQFYPGRVRRRRTHHFYNVGIPGRPRSDQRTPVCCHTLGFICSFPDRDYFPRRSVRRFWQSVVNHRKWSVYRCIGAAQF